MNPKIVSYTIGKTVLLEGLMMLIPTIVALIYHESIISFLIAILIALAVGALLISYGKNSSERLSSRDGFVIVTMAWVVLSLIGALPFYLSGSIPSYIDAFFEAVSGFTTTGASIIKDVEVLGKGILFWRSFSHWIGGMGVLVFVLAVAERNPNRSINILKAEMPGSRVDKLKPKAKTTAKILYLIYMVMTFIEVMLLLVGGMPLYDSLVHSFGTAGTGGYGIYSDSIGGFSPYLQMVIAVFMMLFAVNFSIYYLAIAGRWRAIMRSVELKWFLGIIAIATIIILIANQSLYASLGENFRNSFFQVTSIISTTGYSTVDFDAWPEISKTVLFLLMFIGGCEGSTAGGFKVSRVMILSHSTKYELRHHLHPRMVSTVTVGNKAVPHETINSITSYLTIYIIVAATSFILVSMDKMNFETNISAVVSCLNNIGPGFAGVGPAANFAAYSGFSKIVLSITMLLGRLEIYPIILTFAVENPWKVRISQ